MKHLAELSYDPSSSAFTDTVDRLQETSSDSILEILSYVLGLDEAPISDLYKDVRAAQLSIAFAKLIHEHPGVLRLLQNGSSPNIRFLITYTAAVLDPPDVALLRAMLKDKEPRVRNMARSSLKSIEGS